MNTVAQENENNDEIELVLAYHKGDVLAAIEALPKERDFLIKHDRICQSSYVDGFCTWLEADGVREMNRSRGEPPKTPINREQPFQVVLFLTEWHRTNVIEMLNDRGRLGEYHLRGTVRHNIPLFEIALFQTKAGQQEFIRLYGGISYDPTDKKSKPWETYFDQ